MKSSIRWYCLKCGSKYETDHFPEPEVKLECRHCDGVMKMDEFVVGDEEKLWATVSDCPPERSVEYWDTEEEARKALKDINKLGCGGQCEGKKKHFIWNMLLQQKRAA